MGLKKLAPVAIAVVGVLAYRKFKHRLSNFDYWLAAQRLGCEPAAIKAVAAIESAGKGWTKDGDLKTRLEAQFLPRYQAQSKKAAKSFFSFQFKEAYKYDRYSAIMSSSFGIFQIMGFNYKIVGYASPYLFYLGMRSGAIAQLNAFVKFVEANKLGKYLQDKNWAAFAYRYNGPGYAANSYDTKMAYYYNQFKK